MSIVNKIKSITQKILFDKRNIAKRIFRFYFFSILIGSLLLFMPFAQNNTLPKLSFLDAVFTASSVFTVTGLTLSNISLQFNFFGQLIIFMLFHLGGIGFMTIRIGIYLLLRRKIGFEDRRTITYERGDGKIGGSIAMIKSIMIFIFAFELLLAIIIGINFYFRYFNNPAFPFDGNWFNLIWQSLFLSASATNNAGVYLAGSATLEIYRQDYLLQTLLMVAIVIGGIGFPVIYEIIQKIKSRKNEEIHRWSLFFKISMLTYFVVMIVGLGLFFIIELAYPSSFLYDKGISLFEKIYQSLFFIVTTRNAGISFIDVNSLAPGSKVLTMMLMWIGAAPSSTGGGIRTTTFFLIILAIVTTIRGKTTYQFKNRTIPDKIIVRALLIGVTSFILLFSATTIVVSTSHLPTEDVLFEMFSIFGTTGLSTGITNLVGTVGKIVMIFLMFIGQLGISITLLSFSNIKNSNETAHYPEEDVPIS